MYIINWKPPFIHKFQEEEEREAQVLLPWSKLEEFFASDFYQTNTAGVTINEDTALKHSAYWRAVNLLSSQLASFPIDLFKFLPDGNREKVMDHPAIKLLTLRPNNIMTPFIWREASQANVLTRGNCFSIIKRNYRGEPESLKPVNPEDIKIKTDGENLIYEFPDKSYIDSYYMLHIPGLSFDGISGRAVLSVAAESLGVSLAMQKYSANMFKNGAKQTGVLMHPMALSPEARQGLRKSFDKNMTGDEGGTMVLDEGMKWMATGIPPDQAQLLQSKQFGVTEIARWFGIPPHLLYEESRSTFNNIAEQGISFITYTLTQWVERWEAELENKLLTEEERATHFFKFNMDSLMRGNPQDRAAYIAQMIQNGVFSINEGRKLHDLNSIEGGDKHYVQVNMEDINKNGKEAI